MRNREALLPYLNQLKLNTMENFTIADALTIQLEHIKQWKKVLNTDTFMRLICDIDERNKEGYAYPHQVVRGTDIYNMVANYMNEC